MTTDRRPLTKAEIRKEIKSTDALLDRAEKVVQRCKDYKEHLVKLEAESTV